MVMSVWLAMLFLHATCAFSSDSDPTVILSLAPPAHPHNDISNLLGSWEAHEEEVEDDCQKVYNCKQLHCFTYPG